MGKRVYMGVYEYIYIYTYIYIYISELFYSQHSKRTLFKNAGFNRVSVLIHHRVANKSLLGGGRRSS